MKRPLMALPLAALLLAALLLAVLACGASEYSSDDSGAFYQVESDFASAPAASLRTEGQVLPKVEAAEIKRKIVTNVDVHMVVDDVGTAINAVSDLVRERNGYIVSSSRNDTPGDEQANVSFRVPSETLDDSLEALKRLGTRVTNENRWSDDVTEEFVDLTARLDNLRAAERQVLQLLERADSVTEILEVQRELTNVRGEIERLQGRLNYLETTTSTSLVSAYMFLASSRAAIGDPGWSPAATANRAARGLAAFGRWFTDLLITLAIFSPVWLPIIGVTVALVLLDQRRQRRNREKAAQAPLGAQEPTGASRTDNKEG